MSITFHYYRFHKIRTESFETVEDAIDQMALPFDNEEFYPSHITDKDGKVLLEEQEIIDLLWDKM